MAYIKKHVDSVDAVLILANATVIAGGVLHTLSTILPKPLANNIGIVFTNASSPFSLDFSRHTVPEAFWSAPQFVLEHPTKILNNVNEKWVFQKNLSSIEVQRARNAERGTLGMLVKLFN